jgi:hypothetical protein
LTSRLTIPLKHFSIMSKSIIFLVSEGCVYSTKGNPETIKDIIPDGCSNQSFLDFILDKVGVQLDDIGISNEHEIEVYRNVNGGLLIDIQEVYEPVFENYELEDNV